MPSTIPFKAEHLDQLDPETQLRAFVSPDDFRALEKFPSWSVVDEVDGAVIACGGAFPRWPHVAQAWSYLGTGRPHRFLWIHRCVLQFLNACGFARVEILVRTDFAAGHRWARMLGFELEAPRLRLYGPDRLDYSLYARIQ